jgi:hypothetical protein
VLFTCLSHPPNFLMNLIFGALCENSMPSDVVSLPLEVNYHKALQSVISAVNIKLNTCIYMATA